MIHYFMFGITITCLLFRLVFTNDPLILFELLFVVLGTASYESLYQSYQKAASRRDMLEAAN